MDIRGELARRWRKKIRISVKYELLHFNSTRGSGWCITIKMSKIYNGKINVVSFVIQSCRELTIGVKIEVSINKWDRGSCLLLFVLFQILLGILMNSSQQN